MKVSISKSRWKWKWKVSEEKKLDNSIKDNIEAEHFEDALMIREFQLIDFSMLSSMVLVAKYPAGKPFGAIYKISAESFKMLHEKINQLAVIKISMVVFLILIFLGSQGLQQTLIEYIFNPLIHPLTVLYRVFIVLLNLLLLLPYTLIFKKYIIEYYAKPTTAKSMNVINFFPFNSQPDYVLTETNCSSKEQFNYIKDQILKLSGINRISFFTLELFFVINVMDQLKRMQISNLTIKSSDYLLGIFSFFYWFIVLFCCIESYQNHRFIKKLIKSCLK